MNSPMAEKDKNVLEEFERCGYSYMNRLFDRWKRRVYFHDSAKARLGCILGYIIGLKHAGKEEFAEKLAEDIDSRLNQLSFPHNDFEIVIEGKDEDGNDTRTVTKVPNRKCVVGDDGTWHGFTLMWYSVLNPAVYEEHLKEARKQVAEASNQASELRDKLDRTKDSDVRTAILHKIREVEIYETPHQLVVKKLRILERIDPNYQYSEELTEYKYVDSVRKEFYYVPSFNGGLIYHGPGAGETFTVNFGSETLWGIHT